jgi:hypothetical protein
VGKKYFQSRLQCRESLMHDLSLVPPNASQSSSNSFNSFNSPVESSGANTNNNNNNNFAPSSSTPAPRPLFPPSVRDVAVLAQWARGLEAQALEQHDELQAAVDRLAGASKGSESGENAKRDRSND